MKLLLVKLLGEFHDEEKIEVISDKNDILRLKEVGLGFARERGVHDAKWANWSLPAMGYHKLKEPSKFLLELSETEFLVISE